jgi:hypothetical protein
VSSARIASNRWLRNIRQRASHAHLSRDVSQLPTPPLRSRRARLDAIIVPASRSAEHLQQAIELSAFLGAFLVVLCSKKAKIDEVAEQAARTPAARSLVVEVSKTWTHPDFPRRTSARPFREASANRRSDLSAKRNIGLLLARLHGWTKIVFADDDIVSLQADSLIRLARQLENHQVAGMVVRDHPDNSVVCHARRVVGRWQDVFVSGAVLGVGCNDLPLSFFPDIYNEDWLFFAGAAADHELPSVGEAKQAKYDPFANPDRARWEEFGDLLAEGLYALFGRQGRGLPFDQRLGAATSAYWWFFIEARLKLINRTLRLLNRLLDCDPNNSEASSALKSLSAAKSQLKVAIKPDLCTNFIDAWLEDLEDWQKFSSGVNNVGTTAEAMDFLGLQNWQGPNLVPLLLNTKKRRTGLTNPVTP